MSGFNVVTTTKTFCSQCGKELQSAKEWALCRRAHSLEYHMSTPEGREALEMLRGMGFKDEPDPWMK